MWKTGGAEDKILGDSGYSDSGSNPELAQSLQALDRAGRSQKRCSEDKERRPHEAPRCLDEHRLNLDVLHGDRPGVPPITAQGQVEGVFCGPGRNQSGKGGTKEPPQGKRCFMNFRASASPVGCQSLDSELNPSKKTGLRLRQDLCHPPPHQLPTKYVLKKAVS